MPLKFIGAGFGRTAADAPVNLTNRSPESWWSSLEKTVLPGIARSADP